ncbi:MAG: L-threonylcarbamoyladenylate synthase [Candidatus Gastranaerophilales bacterium]|nr:L-threonylcarbamoyladenylate synthase [Candidatus Gastranaerophilales bacterium]
MNNFLSKKKEYDVIKRTLEKKDGVIAFPTDTVWGIGCLVENKDAVTKIYNMKERPDNKPLILLGSNINAFLPYVNNFSAKAKFLIKKYMPGSLTLVVKKSNLTPDYITSGFDTVGIRVPNCPFFLDLLNNSTQNKILATTSANLSGESASISNEEVKKSLGSKVDFIFNIENFYPSTIASTVALIDENDNIKILRQGSVIISEDLV